MKPILNPLGTKRIGEVGIAGVSAAIAHTIFNDPSKQVCNLPITPDKLL